MDALTQHHETSAGQAGRLYLYLESAYTRQCSAKGSDGASHG